MNTSENIFLHVILKYKPSDDIYNFDEVLLFKQKFAQYIGNNVAITESFAQKLIRVLYSDMIEYRGSLTWVQYLSFLFETYDFVKPEKIVIDNSNEYQVNEYLTYTRKYYFYRWNDNKILDYSIIGNFQNNNKIIGIKIKVQNQIQILKYDKLPPFLQVLLFRITFPVSFFKNMKYFHWKWFTDHGVILSKFFITNLFDKNNKDLKIFQDIINNFENYKGFDIIPGGNSPRMNSIESSEWYSYDLINTYSKFAWFFQLNKNFENYVRYISYMKRYALENNKSLLEVVNLPNIDEYTNLEGREDFSIKNILDDVIIFYEEKLIDKLPESFYKLLMVDLKQYYPEFKKYITLDDEFFLLMIKTIHHSGEEADYYKVLRTTLYLIEHNNIKLNETIIRNIDNLIVKSLEETKRQFPDEYSESYDLRYEIIPKWNQIKDFL